MPARPAAGGGRWVDVSPARLRAWLDGFAARHGSIAVSADGGVLRARGFDGALATLHTPPGARPTSDVESFVAEAGRLRRFGLLLARQAAVAVGVAEGDRLLSSKVDSSYVQGRTAAGGWSQQRFARRRANQAKAAVAGAAEIVARILLPEAGSLVAVVTGGDRRTVEAILADPRLAPVAALRAERFLDIREPRLAVLQAAVGAARSVRILVEEPPPENPPRSGPPCEDPPREERQP